MCLNTLNVQCLSVVFGPSTTVLIRLLAGGYTITRFSFETAGERFDIIRLTRRRSPYQLSLTAIIIIILMISLVD